ncbi:MAG: phospho-N-acetylmuramoyl-pentapeptide-transferase [Anaerolineae bacterium]|jgi:phospho-N-acetylmuramoyl-pentapeptide-transferase|nr:phospho-N-acetylmuramoyl-pentapeptide-transferase [Anaerolineae bacterium]
MSFALALGAVSFFLAVIWGPPLIRLLRKYRIGKQIRVELPTTHQTKLGTPTMGGLMIVVPVALITVALNLANFLSGFEAGKQILAFFNFEEGSPLIGKSILLPLLVMGAFGLLGGLDDLSEVRGWWGGEGLKARVMFPLQFILAILVAIGLYHPQFLGLHEVGVPGVRQVVDVGIWYVPIAALLIVFVANAVNLTDGLDGLAGSTAAVTFVAYGIIAFLQRQYPLLSFSFTMVGALFAFLWFNSHPAILFMGGMGSLALGATLAVVALMSFQWLLLPIIALIFVAEAGSVIIQVGWFKLSRRLTGAGKRVFKMTPLHLHFELLGWSETHITQRFWIIGVLAAMLGIALALL